MPTCKRSRCQLLINKLEKLGVKHIKDPNVFIEYYTDIKNIYPNADSDILSNENAWINFFLIIYLR